MGKADNKGLSAPQMALVDANPESVIQACRRMRSYLEEIRTSIESNSEAPIIVLDFDAISQLLMPQKRSSSQAGLLWHGVVTARELRHVNKVTDDPRNTRALTNVRKIQIPEGAKRELRHFCRKLVTQYEDIVEGPTAQKFGLEPEDLRRLLSDDELSDDELGGLVRKFGSVELSLKLLDSLLQEDIEFSRLTSPREKDVRFQDYLARIEMQRPEPSKSLNNKNDALNLTQTSDLRSHGQEAYLVTTTRAVRNSEDRITREPFYFALGLAVRYKFRDSTRDATAIQLDLMIARLTDAIRRTTEYAALASASKNDSRPDVRADLQQEVSLLRKALFALGSDAILKQLADLLSEAASAVSSAQDGDPGAVSGYQLQGDVAAFSKFHSLVNRLKAHLGEVPNVTLQRKRLSSEHLSYSLIDRQGKILIAADLYEDELAIAWNSETTVPEFCSSVAAYYGSSRQPVEAKVLARLAGLPQPRIFTVSAVESLGASVSAAIGETKASLIKIVCGPNIFWYDASALYAFDYPEETMSSESAKVAVSVEDKNELSQLTDFFLSTSIECWPRVEAQTHLRKLLRMEEK